MSCPLRQSPSGGDSHSPSGVSWDPPLAPQSWGTLYQAGQGKRSPWDRNGLQLQPGPATNPSRILSSTEEVQKISLLCRDCPASVASPGSFPPQNGASRCRQHTAVCPHTSLGLSLALLTQHLL